MMKKAFACGVALAVQLVGGVCLGAGEKGGSPLEDFPPDAEPTAVGKRISDLFLRTRPECYCPPGYNSRGYNDKGYGLGKFVQYSVVSLWVNALECARLAGDRTREEKLVRLYDDFLPGGRLHALCSRTYHVDDTVFGAIAYEIYLLTGDRRCLDEGARYADTQWTPPCEASVKERHALPRERQEALWREGYTPQTRLWIDDMYMIIALQSQAYRATGDRKYIDRAAKEMCLYLDELQLKDGRAEGLFYHAPDAPYVWGRGDGWMAAGMAMVLKYLPEDSVYRARILSGYRKMMRALLKYQRPDGLWSQLVDEPDDPRNWPESSCSAMFASAFITGVRHGWLDAVRYGAAARKAWLALCASMDPHGNVPQTCCGTGKKDDHQYYFDRTRVDGDPHCQAAMLWCVVALAEKVAPSALKTPETSKLFDRYVDPVSGVTSYVLRQGLAGWNQQSLYFTARSMTDDGRFLVFDISQDERVAPVPYHIDTAKTKACVDFLKDEIVVMDGTDGGIPYVDTESDVLYYGKRDANGDPLPFIYRRDLLVDPRREIVCCRIPEEVKGGGKKVLDYFTHLTLTRDRRYAFLESKTDCNFANTFLDDKNPGGIYQQGLLELSTGKYTPWSSTKFYCNHGQVHPYDPTLALCAWDGCWKHILKRGDVFPRLHFVRANGSVKMIPPTCGNCASHEIWTDDGKGFSYCGYGTIYCDLASGRQEVACPIYTTHSVLTRDRKFVLYDSPYDGWYRGRPWRVGLWNRETGRKVYIYAQSAPLNPEFPSEKVSRLHPDPHPHFVMDERYAVMTWNGPDRRMNLMVTPMKPVWTLTEGPNEREVWDLSETVFCGTRSRLSPEGIAAWDRLQAWLVARTGFGMRASGRALIMKDVAAPGEQEPTDGRGVVKIDNGRAFFYGDLAKAIDAFMENVPAGVRVTIKDGTIWQKD